MYSLCIYLYYIVLDTDIRLSTMVSKRISLGSILDPTPTILHYILIIGTDDIMSPGVNGSYPDARGQWRYMLGNKAPGRCVTTFISIMAIMGDRTYDPILNRFYTTSFSILKSKRQTTYEVIMPINIHCNFEKVSNIVFGIIKDH
ncbi:hypothetical protein H8356DRAFT_1350072 [Neocallimastix lanati (nom. inval.)]|nr:hypothetical protein H8356DRAFT_1350072 [Neocallimastix sp. JGI-2020a]